MPLPIDLLLPCPGGAELAPKINEIIDEVNTYLPVVVENASETAKGVVEEATLAELVAGTDTGSTGAKLFVTPSKLNALFFQNTFGNTLFVNQLNDNASDAYTRAEALGRPDKAFDTIQGAYEVASANDKILIVSDYSSSHTTTGGNKYVELHFINSVVTGSITHLTNVTQKVFVRNSVVTGNITSAYIYLNYSTVNGNLSGRGIRDIYMHSSTVKGTVIPNSNTIGFSAGYCYLTGGSLIRTTGDVTTDYGSYYKGDGTSKFSATGKIGTGNALIGISGLKIEANQLITSQHYEVKNCEIVVGSILPTQNSKGSKYINCKINCTGKVVQTGTNLAHYTVFENCEIYGNRMYNDMNSGFYCKAKRTKFTLTNPTICSNGIVSLDYSEVNISQIDFLSAATLAADSSYNKFL